MQLTLDLFPTERKRNDSGWPYESPCPMREQCGAYMLDVWEQGGFKYDYKACSGEYAWCARIRAYLGKPEGQRAW